MPTYIVLSPLLHNGTFYEVGESAVLSDEVAQCLILSGAVKEAVAPQDNDEEDRNSYFLLLVNIADSANDLTQIPGIGTVTATAILERRPQDGYQSLAQLKELCDDLSRIKWAEIEKYRGEV